MTVDMIVLRKESWKFWSSSGLSTVKSCTFITTGDWSGLMSWHWNICGKSINWTMNGRQSKNWRRDWMKQPWGSWITWVCRSIRVSRGWWKRQLTSKYWSYLSNTSILSCIGRILTWRRNKKEKEKSSLNLKRKRKSFKVNQISWLKLKSSTIW